MSLSDRATIQVHGATLAYELAGSGPAVILLHGHLLDLRQWDSLFALLARSYQVLRYDARGFGESTLPALPFDHAADLHLLMQQLGLEHAWLIGSSGGGGICLDFVLQYPHMVDGLVLAGSSIGGFVPRGQIPGVLWELREALMQGEQARAVELSLQAFTAGPRRTIAQIDPVVAERTRAMTARLYARPAVPAAVARALEPPAIERLGEIRVPTLVVLGGEDQQMVLDTGAVLAAQVRGARQ